MTLIFSLISKDTLSKKISSIEVIDNATAPILFLSSLHNSEVKFKPFVVKLGTMPCSKVLSIIDKKSGCSKGSPPPIAT